MEEYKYLKKEALNKLYITEAINIILSMNHQTMNIMLMDYFDKDHFPYESIKLDRLSFYCLKPEMKVIDYINNQFELIDETCEDVEVLDGIVEKVDLIEVDEKAYREACDKLKELCLDQRASLQDVRYQEGFKTDFEQIVAELKEKERLVYDEKKKNRAMLREMKNGLSRLKVRLVNLYCKRLGKDIKFYSLTNEIIMYQCRKIGTYLDEYDGLLNTKLPKNFSVQARTEINYGENLEMDEFYPYDSNWPPFKDFITELPLQKRKLNYSFNRLLICLRKSITENGDMQTKIYFEMIESFLSKIQKMVEFMTSNINSIRFEIAHEDVHRFTASHIRHFTHIIKRLENIYKEVCSGSARKFYQSIPYQEESKLAARNLEIVKDLKARLDENEDAQSTVEFWNNYSMRCYHALQVIYEKLEKKSFVEALQETLENVRGELKMILSSTKLFEEGMRKTIPEVEEDNKLYEEYLQSKFLDSKKKVYEDYKNHKFTELFKIDAYMDFVRVRFPESKEDFYVNIPSYFIKTIKKPEEPKKSLFEYVKFPQAPEEKKGIKSHAATTQIEESEPLKNELDREFHYFTAAPELYKWTEIHTQFFDKMTLEQFLNMFLRSRNILYKGKHYDYMDQIALTKAEDSSITKERVAVVSSLEDIMKKGYGLARYHLGTKRILPFPIPFTDGAVDGYSKITMFLLSTEHLVSFARTTTEGIPTADSFVVISATDITQQTNGVEVKWSYAIEWLKSNFIKGIIESKVPGEIKTNLEDWCEIAGEVLKLNKPEVERERPKVESKEEGVLDLSNNFVFSKSVEELNRKEEEEKDDEWEDGQYASRYGFEAAKERTVETLMKSVVSPEKLKDWHILKKNPVGAGEEVDSSFEGNQEDIEVNELDDKQKNIGYGTLIFIGLCTVYRMLFFS